MRRLFIMSPRLILDEVRGNANIWPLSKEELDRLFEEQPAR